MPWGVAAAAVAGVASNAISSSNQAGAAQTASNDQLLAAQQAQQTQLHMYNQTRQDLSPYLSTGTSALSELSRLFGLGGPGHDTGLNPAQDNRLQSALQNYPGYQFQLNQGDQALDRSAASRGLLLSGAQLKDTQAYGQGLGASALQSYLGNLTGLAGLGESAGAQVGGFGTTAGQGIASSQLAGGQAQAAGAIGSANALTSGLQGGLNSALLGYQLYNGGSGVGSSGGTGLDTASIDATLNAPLTLSDVRAKTDIERVGKTDGGLSIYTYRYKAGGPKQMGVMAQEVEKVNPGAVITLPSGLKMVNYGKISPLSDYRMAA